jgi:hypothetical protein
MTHSIVRFAMVIAVSFGLAACAALPDRGPRGAGLPFDARLDQGQTWRDITVVVRAPGATLSDVRESARFMATRHCLERSGFSAVDWVIDPATGDWAVARSAADEPVVTGRCVGR